MEEKDKNYNENTVNTIFIWNNVVPFRGIKIKAVVGSVSTLSKKDL